MNFKTISLLVIALFTLGSCLKSLSSILVVDKSFREAKQSLIYNLPYGSEDVFKLHYEADTLIIITNDELAPIDIMCIFREDVCIYQEINFYCAPCADTYIETILIDRYYGFKALDAVNWKAKKKNVVMKLRDQNESSKTCTKVIANKPSLEI